MDEVILIKFQLHDIGYNFRGGQARDPRLFKYSLNLPRTFYYFLLMSFIQHTYTPKYIPTVYSPIVSVASKLNPEQHKEKNSFASNQLKQEILSKPQISSEIKIPPKLSKETYKKPRTSVYEFYKPADEHEDSFQHANTPKIHQQKQFTEMTNSRDTKYFLNATLTKKANSDHEAPKNASKINQTIKEKLESNQQMRVTEKPIMFDKTRKGSMNYPKTEISQPNGEFFDHPNLKRFKSPMASTLKEEFRKVMMDINDPELYQRKTQKSTKSKVDHQEKVIMTRKQLQIMKLRHNLTQLQKQQIQEKLSWCQKEKAMSLNIHRMEKQIQELQEQNGYIKKTQQVSFDAKHKRLKEDYEAKCRFIKELQNDNTLLIENLLSAQTTYSKIKIEQTQEMKVVMEEIRKMREKQDMFGQEEESEGLHSGSFLRKMEGKGVGGEIKEGEELGLEKELVVKEQYIKMLVLKIEGMEKQMFLMKLGLKRLRLTEMLLVENNQNTFKHCLRRLENELGEQSVEETDE